MLSPNGSTSFIGHPSNASRSHPPPIPNGSGLSHLPTSGSKYLYRAQQSPVSSSAYCPSNRNGELTLRGWSRSLAGSAEVSTTFPHAECAAAHATLPTESISSL